MRLLAFSDIHRDRAQAKRLVEMSEEADLVVGAGDFASWHLGLGRTIAVLEQIRRPSIFVPGNNESAEALSRACAGAPNTFVLHGSARRVEGVDFFGLGAAIPPTPLPWSFDLSEERAQEMLQRCPQGAVLVVHSPPKGCLDKGSRAGMGSGSIVAAIARVLPPLVICGHIHQQGGKQASLGGTKVVNAGPKGILLEL